MESRKLTGGASPGDEAGFTRAEVLRKAGVAAGLALGGPALLAACGATSSTTSGQAAATGPIRRGGHLRVAVASGSTKDTLDPANPLSNADSARIIQLFDTLAHRNPDFSQELALAEEFEIAPDGRSYTVRVRPDVEFHNGKTLGAEDVAFTIRRILNPKSPGAAAIGLSSIDLNNMKILDKRTLRIALNQVYVGLEQQFAAIQITGIVPVGFDLKKPVGTGPFKLVSFTPGTSSVMVKNENYWRSGEPYVDRLTIFDISDDTARVNALLGGQVDAIDQLPLANIPTVQANQSLSVLEAKTGKWIPFYMNMSEPPFDDVRVREAFRLIVDRPQMVEQALAGHGTVANDMPCQLDPAYPKLPQRKQNIAKAKELLAAAGHKNLTVQCDVGEAVAGMVPAAQVFAQQAAQAGVTVKVNNLELTDYYNTLGKAAFGMDYWSARPFFSQVTYSELPGASLNDGHFDNPQFTSLAKRASQTLDPSKSASLIGEALGVEYDAGTWIIWGNPNSLDAHRSVVQGFVPDVSGIGLSSYRFRQAWFSA
jgi:peptide/nickel transport system substrate-binding protein